MLEGSKLLGYMGAHKSLFVLSCQVTDCHHDAVQVCVNNKAGQSDSLSLVLLTVC